MIFFGMWLIKKYSAKHIVYDKKKQGCLALQLV